MIPTILSRGLGLFLLPVYTRFLSPEQYGILDLFSVLMSLINLTIALEISQALARYYQEYQDQEIRKSYVSTAFLFTCGMYFLYILVSVYFADFFTIYLLNTLENQHIFYLATISIATNGVFLFAQNQLRWQLEAKKYMYTSLVYTFLTTTISIYLLMNTILQVESLFIAQIIANILALCLSIYFGKKNYAFIFIKQNFIQMIKFSAPLVISSSAVFMTLYVDRVIIKEMLGLYFLGIYGIAYKFASIAGLVISGFQSSLMPLIYKHYKESETPYNISKVFSIYILFAIFILTGSILFSKEIVMLMTTSKYYAASKLIPFLICTIFLNQMYNFAPGLGISNKTFLSAFIYLAGALMGILLNLFLIKSFGLIGSAIVSVLNSFFVFALYCYFAQKYYTIPYQWGILIKILLITITLTFIILFFLQNITLLNSTLKMIFLILIGIYLLKENQKNGLFHDHHNKQ